MGYIHYYENKKMTDEQWDKFSTNVKKLLANVPAEYLNSASGKVEKIILTGCGKYNNPTVNKSCIWLNGGWELKSEYSELFEIVRVKEEEEHNGKKVAYWNNSVRMKNKAYHDVKFTEDTIKNMIGTMGDHETFVIKKKGGNEFCKTARKPYDVVVTAILIMAVNMFPEIFTASSDGDYEEWLSGEKLLQDIFGIKSKLIYPKQRVFNGNTYFNVAFASQVESKKILELVV